jgi:hypothetical protein
MTAPLPELDDQDLDVVMVLLELVEPRLGQRHLGGAPPSLLRLRQVRAQPPEEGL